jgi:hypothetical protein
VAASWTSGTIKDYNNDEEEKKQEKPEKVIEDWTGTPQPF